jgi:hypothetical protein
MAAWVAGRPRGQHPLLPHGSSHIRWEPQEQRSASQGQFAQKQRLCLVYLSLVGHPVGEAGPGGSRQLRVCSSSRWVMASLSPS